MERLTERVQELLDIEKKNDLFCITTAERAEFQIAVMERIEEYDAKCEELAKYKQLEENGLILPAPLNGVDRFTLDGNTWWVRANAETEHKDYIEQVANMLGVQLNEEFKIRPTEKAKLLGVRENDKTFRFDTALVYKGYDDGWSKWYGFGCEHVLYYLLLGYYEVDRAGIKEIGE